MFFLTFKAKKIYSNIQFHAKFVFLDFTHAENENTPPLKGSDKTTDEVCGNNNGPTRSVVISYLIMSATTVV